jgi:hypothetical protein
MRSNEQQDDTNPPLVLFHAGNRLPAHLCILIGHIHQRFPNQQLHLLTSRDIVKQLKPEIASKLTQLVDLQGLQKTQVHERIYRSGGHWINQLTEFFKAAALRLYYLYDYMVSQKFSTIIHIESDNLLFVDPKLIVNQCSKHHAVYYPLDADRGIASVFVATSKESFLSLLEFISNGGYRNEMEALGEFANVHYGGSFRPLPTVPKSLIKEMNMGEGQTRRFTCTDGSFDGFIYDAAAIGQYVDGVDPIHTYRSKPKFVNERTILPLDTLSITWLKHESKKYPALISNQEVTVVSNLHIHSKRLDRFSNSHSNVHDWAQDPLSGDDFQSVCDITISNLSRMNFHKSFNLRVWPYILIDEPYFHNEMDVPLDNIQLIDSRYHIFIYGDHKEFFKKKILPRLRYFHKLTLHNSDIGIENSDIDLLDNPLLEQVFTANSNVSHPKLIHIPLGIANSHWPHGSKEKLINEAKSYIKTRVIYSNFRPTHPTRVAAFQEIQGVPWITIDNDLDYVNYLKTAKMFRFMICPRGNGIDTHRFWESIALDCIPIILEKEWIPAYSNYRHLCVKNWVDLKDHRIVDLPL